MKKILTKILMTISVINLCLLGLVGDVSAAGKNFALSPMSQRVVLMPGELYRGAITVAVPADSNDQFDYIVSPAPYSLGKSEVSDKDLGGSDFETRNNQNLIVDWISIDNPEGTIEPNEQRTVSFTINVPNDAPGGGQYAALLVRENNPSETNNDSMAIKEIMQMAHIIYAEVAGETRTEGEIIENNIPSFLLSNNLHASSTVKNSGNIHADVEYTLQIWPMFSNEELYANEEDPEKILVLPGVTKYHEQEYNLPSIGIFRAKQTVKIFGEESIVEKTIIVCPLWLLFIIIFVVFALIFYFVAKAKARKKATKKAEKSA